MFDSVVMSEDSKDGSKTREKELEFTKKYGSIKPKPRLIARESKHFDSADWIMEKNSINTKSPPTTELNTQDQSTPSKDSSES